MDSLYEKLSNERKKLQASGDMPDWWSTGAWQLFKAKYMYQAKTPREQYQRIAKTMAQYIEGTYPDWWEVEGYTTWEQAFFDEFWCGNLSGSTPVVGNAGTDKGMSVSCSGSVIPNSINGIYEAKREVAVLTKHSFGTASYIGNIQARGTPTGKGQVAAGVLPVIKGFVHDMEYVAQGGRRGAWAAYLPLEHGDFYEVVKYLEEAPDGLNIGWIVTDNFIKRLDNDDEDAVDRFQEHMTAKMKTGKGYHSFIDKINARRPQIYVDMGLYVVAPQLCNEIHLHSSEDLTYTCVLSSTNAAMWKQNEIKGSKSVFIHTVFLDCVAEDFIRKSEGVSGLEKARRFTQLGRALGLGVCGLHTLFQKERISFESMEAHMLNNEIFKHIHDQSLEASQWMAKALGEPAWCKGYGVRNTHRTAVAPTKSSALLMGGVSEGINPDPGMTYTQLTPAGEVERANPILLEIMKERGVYDDKHMQEIIAAQGSVQKVDWLTPEEKQVFKTAFEIDQKAILRLASARQHYLCQGQSLNLFFSADEDEEYIAEVHAEAFHDPMILGLYYCYSKAGVTASKGECEVCQ